MPRLPGQANWLAKVSAAQLSDLGCLAAVLIRPETHVVSRLSTTVLTGNEAFFGQLPQLEQGRSIDPAAGEGGYMWLQIGHMAGAQTTGGGTPLPRQLPPPDFRPKPSAARQILKIRSCVGWDQLLCAGDR